MALRPANLLAVWNQDVCGATGVAADNDAMLTPKGLFFAPGIRFKALDVNNPDALAEALAERITRWFFAPARQIARSSPFASGIVVACVMDAAAQLEGVNLADWLRRAVPSSADVDSRRGNKTIADSFEEDVRHGLVHSARLSRGAEFSLDLEQPLAVIGSVLVVNPLELLGAVETRWQVTISDIRSNPQIHRRTADHIQRVFSADFMADATWTEKGA